MQLVTADRANLHNGFDDIVNASPRVYQARVATNAVVWQVRLEETSSADLKAGTFAGLVAYLAAHETGSSLLSHSPYWLTVVNGEDTTICEQYVP